MLLNVSLFICYSLLIYSYFVFKQNKNFYRNMKKVANIVNLAVSDIYDTDLNKTAFGQNSLPWFTNLIMENCDIELSEKQLYDSFQHCLYPYCQIRTDLSKYISEVLN